MTYRNLMITMALGGLWHGARANFIIWGVYHGLLLSAHRFLSRWRGDTQPDGRIIGALKMVGMFHLTLFGWVLFRVESFVDLKRLVNALFEPWSYWDSSLIILLYGLPFIAPLVVVQAFQVATGRMDVFRGAPWPIRAAFVCLCLTAAIMLNQGGGKAFIYFQF